MLYTPPYTKLIRLFYITTAANAYAAFTGFVGTWIFHYSFWPAMQILLVLCMVAGALIYALSFLTAPLTVWGLFRLARVQRERREAVLAPKAWLLLLSLQVVCAIIAWICWANAFL